MKNRQRKTKDPCQICFLHRSFCICDQIPKLNLKTRLSLIVHYKELKRTSNTGRLAVTALINSQMLVRGLRQEKASDFKNILSPDYENIFLYPSDDAVLLDEHFLAKQRKPIHLIVPDGNWRQAGKVHLRHPELAELTRIKLKPKKSATQFLRKEHVEGGMATLEAIALAIAEVEGIEAGNKLSELYRLKLEATLRARGH